MPGHGDPYPLGWPWPAAIPESYFTCQCNPPVETGENWPIHRIPIDCMTAEDWQRTARAKQERAVTVWVVNVIGDEDCGAPNEGAIGVHPTGSGDTARVTWLPVPGPKVKTHCHIVVWTADDVLTDTDVARVNAGPASEKLLAQM